ncbi:MAG: DUF4198 domain-containing protein [Candidatus Krumholzibacteria bacterium]|jgi:hypothetical protein|nr:DUF4198 domain-containing protein [Candidatus Krumholzibacteria bacterium]
MRKMISFRGKAARAALAALFSAAPLLSFAPAARSHEHWFDPGDFYPSAGAATSLRVCSGHHYPESGFAVKDEVLGGVILAAPGGGTSKVPTARGEISHAGSFTTATEGVHILSLALRRPGAADPAFELKAIIVAGGKDDPSAYSTGKGLEIVPLASLAEAAAPCGIPCGILLDGERIEGSLTLFDDGGGSAALKADRESPALVAVKRAGRYLLVAQAAGRECSLVFEVRGGKE